MEANAWLALVAQIAWTLIAAAGIARGTRGMGELPRRAWVIALIFAPLAFAVYTLTKESTAIFEMVLKGLGV
jgi:hypothetical protein